MKLTPHLERRFRKDIDLLEIVNSNFLVNDGQKGLMFLDRNLRVIKKIKLFDNILIHKVLRKFDDTALLLDCIINNKWVVVDLVKNKAVYIENPSERLFSPLYYSWKKHLIVSTYSEQFYRYDETEQQFKEISKATVKKYDPLLLQFQEIACQYSIMRSYANKYQFIYEDMASKIIGFCSMQDHKNVVISYDDWQEALSGYSYVSQNHDFQYIDNGIFILISNDSIRVRRGNYEFWISPPASKYIFKHAVPYFFNDKLYVMALALDQALIYGFKFLQQYYIPEKFNR